MDRLQRMRVDLGLDDLVAFAGARDQQILPYYYAAAEMVVMPSHYESFGMVALEAMAMGTPVIASEVGGLAYVVRDGFNGFLVPRRNAEALAARIADLLNDQPLRQQMSRNAQHYRARLRLVAHRAAHRRRLRRSRRAAACGGLIERG